MSWDHQLVAVEGSRSTAFEITSKRREGTDGDDERHPVLRRLRCVERLVDAVNTTERSRRSRHVVSRTSMPGQPRFDAAQTLFSLALSRGSSPLSSAVKAQVRGAFQGCSGVDVTIHVTSGGCGKHPRPEESGREHLSGALAAGRPPAFASTRCPKPE
jgi:hypothetical protein